MNEAHAETLRGFPLFRSHTLFGAQRLLDAGEVHKLPAGGSVCKEGDPPTFVLLVLTGALEVFVEREGRELVLTRAPPGTILGELAVYCGINRTASIRAVEESAVLQWSDKTFHSLLLGNFDLARQILGRSFRTLIEKEQALIQSLIEGPSAERDPR